MLKSKVVRILVVLAIIGAGAWLLFQSSSLTPETAVRQEAVQLALAPGRQSDSTDAVVAEDGPTIVYGEAVSPAVVDVSSLPSRAAEVDKLKAAYESGQMDMELNEGPVSDAAFQAMVKESARQPVDASVQNYNLLQESLNQTDADIQPLGSVTAGTSFKAIDYTQSQQGVPPDPDITVGTNEIIVAVNTSFQIFSKNGTSLVGPTLFEDFWGTNCATGEADVVLFDPFVDYDEKEHRYILGITAYDESLNGGDNGWACIAVSQTDNAAGSYWMYNFDGNPGTGTDYFFDYPHLGVGQQALYLSANMFGSSFVRNHVFIYDKFAMYAGAAANNQKINIGSTNFTIQPAKMHGYNTNGWPTNPNEPHFFMDAQYGNNQNTLTVWQMNGAVGSATLSQFGTVTVNSYSLPVNQVQSGTGGSITGNDNRLLDVKYMGGKLYATHHIGCNPGGGTVNCIRWYIINVSGTSPSLIDQGTFSSTGDYRSFPAIAPNACGDLMVGYTKMNSSSFPSVYVAGREVGDPAGQLKDETLVHAGEATYTAYDTAPRRWGDYTGMAMDPDGRTFWYVGEYSRNQATARWSTWVSAHTWSACNIGPTPTPGPTATATNTPLPTNTPGPISCTTYASTDVPKSISSSGTPSISSVLNVSSGGTIADVNVLNLNGTHTYVGDLDFNLTSPSGTEIQIMASSCSSNDNFNLNLDDETAAGSWPCPPVGGGTYRPSNALSAFDGQNSTGTWTLRIDDNANLDGGSLNGWSLEICAEGTGPVATNTPMPPTATNTPLPTATNTPGPTATNTSIPPTATNTAVPTATNTPVPGGSDVIYMSSSTNGNVGFAFNDEDIVAYDTGTGTWSMYFDGSDVGVTGDINAFTLLSDGSILMSFNATTTAGAAGSVDDSDIVQFFPTSTGSNTAGTFSFFFDGSDVGLTLSGEDIDAIGVSADGKLVISTTGSYSVTGVSGADEDLIIFTATAFGTTTSGSWALYFDGSDVALNSSSTEDVSGVWIDGASGEVYLTTLGAFSVTGVSGDGSDIFSCVGSFDSTTTCAFSMYWDGSANGFAGEVMDAFEIVR